MAVQTPSLVTDAVWPNRGPVYYPEPSATLSFEIATDASYPVDVIDFLGFKHFALQLDTTFAGVAIRVYGSLTDAEEFGDLYPIENGAGGFVEFDITTAVGRIVAPWPQVYWGLSAVRYISFRSMDGFGAGAAPVVQTADQTVYAMFMG